MNTETAPALQWKWTKPDRRGIWMCASPHKNSDFSEETLSVNLVRYENSVSVDWLEGWWCRLCDIPVIPPPQKQMIKKRLYVRREQAPLDCSPPEIEHRWVSIEELGTDRVEVRGWKYTELVEEFEE